MIAIRSLTGFSVYMPRGAWQRLDERYGTPTDCSNLWKILTSENSTELMYRHGAAPTLRRTIASRSYEIPVAAVLDCLVLEKLVP